MTSLFLQGIVLGFGAAVPIGPINILIMSYALKSYKTAFAIGFGAMSADIFYLFLLSFGLLKVLDSPVLLKNFAIFGFIFLIFIGIALLKGAGKHLHIKKNIKQKRFVTTYVKGLLLTLLNPYTVGFWLSIATLIKSENGGMVPLTTGVIIAILIWITLMPFAVYKNKHRISDNLAKYFSYFAGIILIFFAFILLYNTFGEYL